MIDRIPNGLGQGAVEQAAAERLVERWPIRGTKMTSETIRNMRDVLRLIEPEGFALWLDESSPGRLVVSATKRVGTWTLADLTTECYEFWHTKRRATCVPVATRGCS
jgi:hypothetical protein